PHRAADREDPLALVPDGCSWGDGGLAGPGGGRPEGRRPLRRGVARPTPGRGHVQQADQDARHAVRQAAPVGPWKGPAALCSPYTPFSVCPSLSFFVVKYFSVCSPA